MVERLGTGLSLLDSELSKIALLGEANEPIQQEAVEELVGKSSDEQAWAAQEALLQALQTGSTEQALRTVRELIDLAGQPEPLVMYFVADLFRKLSIGSMLKRAGWQDKQITKHLKVFGPRERMFLAALNRLDRASIRRLFDEALQLDSRSKSGLGEVTSNLERLCVELGRRSQPAGR
jgi:DNA polymerase-3 subunit delta